MMMLVDRSVGDDNATHPDLPIVLVVDIQIHQPLDSAKRNPML
jgi:hypothetical protein